MKNKGITLIALVITIIILLVLAGVTIGFVMNGTGLFDKAKFATEEYNNKAKEESTMLANYENDIDNYLIGDRSNIYTTTLYEDFASASQTTITLSESYKSFKYLIFCYGGSSADLSEACSSIFPVVCLSSIQQINKTFTLCYGRYFLNMIIDNDSSISYSSSSSSTTFYIKGIYGIK